MSSKLQVEMRFHLASGIHVTGERAKLWTDKALTMDWDTAKPTIPATSLKGWLRENAESLLRGLGTEACDGSMADTTCGKCVVCETFGSPRKRSPFRFYDAVLSNANTDVRVNVSLSRHRKTSYEERLVSTEVAWQENLSAQVDGFFNSSEDAQKAAALLYVSAKEGFAMGAARSRGLGWLQLKEFQARLDDSLLSEDTLIDAIRKLLPRGKANQ